MHVKVILLCASFLILVAIYAWPISSEAAQTTGSEVPTEGIPADEVNRGWGSSDEEINIQSYDYIQYGRCLIERSGSNVFIGGQTRASQLVNEIGVTLNLQRWNPGSGSWVTQTSLSPYSLMWSSFVQREALITNIPSNSYYRTVSSNWLILGSTVESLQCTSPYIYID